MCTVLADCGELLPGDLAAAVNLRQHMVPALVASVTAAPVLALPSASRVNAIYSAPSLQ
jgi:hypothetical protein